MKVKETPNNTKKHTDRQLAEAYIYPVENSRVNEKEERDYWELRKKRYEERSPEQVVFANILQLKFEMEDYINNANYNREANFGTFLKGYIDGLGKMNKEFADEIDIKPTELSQLINNHRNPNNEILVRLELHSNNTIPAVLWYKLMEKQKEQYIMNNAELRKAESKHVKGRLSFSL